MTISRRTTLASAFSPTLAAPLALPALAQQGGGGRGRGRRASAGTAAPLAADEFERTALGVLNDIDNNQRYLNVGRDDGRLLRMFVENAGIKRAVEIGTSTGYSGIWIALGLKKTGGRLTTFEIDRERARIAAANLKRTGVADIAEIIIGDANVETKKITGEIDFVFSDADKENYLNYWRTLAPLLRKGGMFISDNMSRPAPDPAYVKAITSDPAFDTVFLNMEGTGVGVSLKKL